METLPIVAIVGRPNVGKSTLFNQLTRSRQALVADFPGLTRDRQYALTQLEGRRCLLVDTGGLGFNDDPLQQAIEKQVAEALNEASVIVFLVDARQGCTHDDEAIAGRLRSLGKPVILTINKIDGLREDFVLIDFAHLGFAEVARIAASQRHGLITLSETIAGYLPRISQDDEFFENSDESDQNNDEGFSAALPEVIKIALIGRPNVGKSTLTNRLLGEERVIVQDSPGTTRDSIAIPLERDGQKYLLIDTAGVRRKSRVEEGIEKFSIIKTLQAIDQAHVLIVLCDAQEGITEQDLHLIGEGLKEGRAIILAINKWDHLSDDQRQNVKRQMDVRLPFIPFAEKIFISALHGSNVGLLWPALQRAFQSAGRKVSTPEVNRLLQKAVQQHAPPLVNGRRIKLRYGHQGGRFPLRLVIHGNQLDELPKSYVRYLEGFFRQEWRLVGTPIVFEWNNTENPFADRRNTLTPRQIHKKRRLMTFVKRRK